MSNVAGQELLLFYIVCDESGSMGMNGGIESINKALPELHAEICADPLAVDKSRLSIIAFSDKAEVILPLTKVTDVADMPGVEEKGATSYGSAFSLMGSILQSDIDSLKSQGYRVFRPLMFFISDGEPTDNWESAYQTLMTHQYRPHIVAFGVDGADASILAKIATLRCFVGRDRSNPGRALATVMGRIGQTIITSTSTSPDGAGVPDMAIPQTIPDFDTVPLEEL
jgi:uncharacterized protein YegL